MEHTYSFFSSSADESDLDRALPSVRGTDAVMGARPPAVSIAACKDLASATVFGSELPGFYSLGNSLTGYLPACAL